MRRIKKFVPVTTLETVYKGLVQPYFEYCSPLVLTGASFDIRSADLIDSLSWQTLDDRRRCAKSMLMYKILNDRTTPSLRTSFV
ncbi:unnamed protein product, partial [Porites evermanni]